MPHAIGTQDVSTLVDQDVEREAGLFDIGADGVGVLRYDSNHLDPAGGVGSDVVGKLTEPAAAVWSPGAAMKGQQQPAAREVAGERVHTPLLIGQREAWGLCQFGAMHQNSFTSTSSPASTMSTWAGIST